MADQDQLDRIEKLLREMQSGGNGHLRVSEREARELLGLAERMHDAEDDLERLREVPDILHGKKGDDGLLSRVADLDRWRTAEVAWRRAVFIAALSPTVAIILKVIYDWLSKP